MSFDDATCKPRTACKISTFFEDLSFLNPKGHLNGKAIKKNIYISEEFTATPPPSKKEEGRGQDGHGSPITFSEIVFSQGFFLGNSLLCHSPRHPKKLSIPHGEEDGITQ